jgi:hypothetical protein
MHLACSNDVLRPVMQHIYFKDGFAYASDAHILAKNKVSEITESIHEDELKLLDGKMLHKSAFCKILEYDRIQITETGITCIGEYSKVTFSFSSDEHLKYPDAEIVFEQVKSNKGLMSRISLKPVFLDILAKSLYSDGKLVLNFCGEGKGILIKSQDKTIESEGIIMPISITE